METKKCRKCNEVLPVSEFYKNSKSKDGLACYCKKCCVKRSTEYYHAHREERLEYGNKYFENRREEHRKYTREYHAKNKERINAKERERIKTPEGREKSREHAAMRRARRKNARVGTMPNRYRAIIRKNQNNLCYYCGCDLSKTGEHLDHKQPLSRGGEHSMENIVLSCPACNMSKGAKTEEEFKAERV